MILIKKISLCFLFSIAISLAVDSLFAENLSGHYFTENMDSKPFTANSLIPETEHPGDETNILAKLDYISDQLNLSEIASVNFPFYIQYIPIIWQPPKNS